MSSRVSCEVPEDVLPAEHPVRVLDRVVGTLDLTGFTAEAKAFEGEAGRSVLSPRMQLTLWLYAISRGIGDDSSGMRMPGARTAQPAPLAVASERAVRLCQPLGGARRHAGLVEAAQVSQHRALEADARLEDPALVRLAFQERSSVQLGDPIGEASELLGLAALRQRTTARTSRSSSRTWTSSAPGRA